MRDLLTRTSLALSLTPLLALAACTSSDTSCAAQSDCFMDQYCVQGACQDEPAATTPTNNVSPGNNVTPNNATPGNNTTPANNTSATNNSTPANNTSSGNNTSFGNNTSSGNNTTPAGQACLSPGLTCAEDEYEKGGFAYNIKPPEPASRFGCVLHSDSEIVGLDAQFEGTLCASDFEGDLYSIEYTRCRDIDLLVEMTVTLDTQECSSEHVDISWSPSCDGATVRCEENHDLDAGVYTFRAVIARVSTVVPSQTVPLRIESVSNGTQFGYTLDVKISDASK